jgi:hypothetical protein
VITDLSIMYAGPLAWRLRWASDDPDATFRVYRDGQLIAQTEQTEAIVAVVPGTAPVFEVLDDPDEEPSDGFPPYVTLQWAQTAETAEYRVEELVSAVWTTLATIPDENAAYYRWTSEPLDDVSSHSYRIVPVGTNGNDGTPLTFAVLLVRVPDPPDMTMSYFSGAGLLTFDLA